MAQLDKPIIHFQIPIKDPNSGYEVDNFAISLGAISLFRAWAEKEMGDNAYIVFSPCNIDVVGAQVEKVKLDEITLAEFLKKHDIKDGTEE